MGNQFVEKENTWRDDFSKLFAIWSQTHIFDTNGYSENWKAPLFQLFFQRRKVKIGI